MRASLPLLALVAALAAPGLASAQTRPAPATGHSSDRYTQERPEAPEQDPSQDLVRQLNLRPDQQTAFRDYQSAFQASAQAQGEGDQDDGDASADVARLAAMTTPQRLDDAARHLDQDRAAFARVSAATRRFYTTLDAAQRRTFDRVTAPRADVEDDGDPMDDR